MDVQAAASSTSRGYVGCIMGHVRVRVMLRNMLCCRLLCSIVFMFHVEWCIRQPLSSFIILCTNNNITQHHHTNNNHTFQHLHCRTNNLSKQKNGS